MKEAFTLSQITEELLALHNFFFYSPELFQVSKEVDIDDHEVPEPTEDSDETTEEKCMDNQLTKQYQASDIWYFLPADLRKLHHFGLEIFSKNISRYSVQNHMHFINTPP